MICPHCGAQNIPGNDVCDVCGHSMIEERDPVTKAELALMQGQISDLFPREALLVSPETTVADVLNLLVENQVGCVVIIEGNKAVGIFSERDALLKLGENPSTQKSEPISKFMTKNPATLEDSSKIAFAVHKMDIGHFRHIPIVNGDSQVTGIISVRDILSFMTKQLIS